MNQRKINYVFAALIIIAALVAGYFGIKLPVIPPFPSPLPTPTPVSLQSVSSQVFDLTERVTDLELNGGGPEGAQSFGIYNTPCRMEQGGGQWTATDGCVWEMQSGATLNIQSGATITMAGYVTSTLDSLTVNGDMVITGTLDMGASGKTVTIADDDNAFQLYATSPTTGYIDGFYSNIVATAGAGAGAVRPFQGAGIAGDGSNLAELYGGSFYAIQNDGSVIGSNVYGAMGYCEIEETDAADDPAGYIAGVMGIYDTNGIDPTVSFGNPGAKAAVIGVVKDNANTTPQAAVMAFCEGDSTGTSCGDAAFKAVDVRSTGGGDFGYGLDLYKETYGGYTNGDVRFENGTVLEESVDTVLTFSEFLAAKEQVAEVVSAGSIIVPTGTNQPISSASSVTCNTTTCIAAGTLDGQLLILTNVNASDTITIDGTGGNVECKADVTLGAQDVLGLKWNGAIWYCMFYYDNS